MKAFSIKNNSATRHPSLTRHPHLTRHPPSTVIFGTKFRGSRELKLRAKTHEILGAAHQG
jgi:hypothetical protein